MTSKYYHQTSFGRTLTEDGKARATALGLTVDIDENGNAQAYRPQDEDSEPVNLDNIQPDSYIMVTGEETWSNEEITEGEHVAACQRAGEWLADHEGPLYDIEVRPAHDGEIVATYWVKPGGDLQILGGSLGVPEAVERLTNRAWEHACGTWPEEDLYEIWERAVEEGATVYRVMECDGTEYTPGVPENRGEAQVLQVGDHWLYVDDVDGYSWIDAKTIDRWRSGKLTTTLETAKCYAVEDNGQWWTGSCWGVYEARETYTTEELPRELDGLELEDEGDVGDYLYSDPAAASGADVAARVRRAPY